MATQSNIFAFEIPRTEEPDGLQSIGSQRVRHDWVTKQTVSMCVCVCVCVCTEHKESTCQCRRHRRSKFDPWSGNILWRKKWQPTLVFLPGKIPWTEEPGRLLFMRLQRVGHYWVIKSAHMHIYTCVCVFMDMPDL